MPKGYLVSVYKAIHDEENLQPMQSLPSLRWNHLAVSSSFVVCLLW